MQGHLRALTALVLAAGAASCGTGAEPPEKAPSARPPASGSAPRPEKALDEFGRIPVEAAARALAALRRATAAGRAEDGAYLELRRAVACGEPLFRERGFMAEALFGAGPADELGGPLGALDAAMNAGDKKEIEENGGEVERALMLLEDAFQRTPAHRGLALKLLPRSAYLLGAIIAESKPGLASAESGVIADAQGLLDFIELGTIGYGVLVSPSLEYTAAVNEASALMRELRRAFDGAKEGGLRDRAGLILTTGKLGRALRAMFAPGADPWMPPVRAASHEEASKLPISVLSIPDHLRVIRRPSKTSEEALAERGEKLFFDKGLSKGGARSCATCHAPEKGYADGKQRPESLDPATPLRRNTPTLLYSSLHAVQFWDGRALTSEKQAESVMQSKAEMGNSGSPFPIPGYSTLEQASEVLAAFEARRLAPADSPLDRFARGDEKALSAADRAGFDVFTGKGRCARCHVPPLFGGSYPTDFSTAVFAALGVPESAEGKALDPDPGREGVTHKARDRGVFKTPTVRDAGLTAPYFHNGAFPTLESVVDFYDKGGGKGLGLSVPNQDPEVRLLKLTEADKKALVHFLRVTLADSPASLARK